MARFYFDSNDGRRGIADKIGVDLPDAHAAQREAVRALPCMAKDALPDGNSREFVVDVRDEDGRSVLRATLSLNIETLT
jgi:hypothetical protein